MSKEGSFYIFIPQICTSLQKKLECIDTIIHSAMYEASRIEGEKPKKGDGPKMM